MSPSPVDRPPRWLALRTRRCPERNKTQTRNGTASARQGHDWLTVCEVTLAANGRKPYPETPLLPDGFDADPDGKFASLQDLSTEDELVRCDKCKETFPLDELAIE